jgi:hypothetical protein
MLLMSTHEQLATQAALMQGNLAQVCAFPAYRGDSLFGHGVG